MEITNQMAASQMTAATAMTNQTKTRSRVLMPDSPAAFSESMQADSSGDRSWVNYQEPHSDPNRHANADQSARLTPAEGAPTLRLHNFDPRLNARVCPTTTDG